MKRLCLMTLIFVAATVPARANYGAGDPREPAMKHLNIKHVSSRVFIGNYLGGRTKLIRFTATFYDSVPWNRIKSPSVHFFMDTLKGTRSGEYVVEFFRLKLIGERARFHCWLERLGGRLILPDNEMADYSKTNHSVTCTFPKAAMKVRPSGVVRWNVLAHYGNFNFDNAPNKLDAWFPHV